VSEQTWKRWRLIWIGKSRSLYPWPEKLAAWPCCISIPNTHTHSPFTRSTSRHRRNVYITYIYIYIIELKSLSNWAPNLRHVQFSFILLFYVFTFWLDINMEKTGFLPCIITYRGDLSECVCICNVLRVLVTTYYYVF
jgi:hypothetical protein